MGGIISEWWAASNRNGERDRVGIRIDTGGGPGTYSMRGFSGGSVSVNYDGVHQPSTMVTRNFDTFAFDRIEVLKGPASVLFGEGALGGAVNFVPKKPILQAQQFQALGQYGSFDAFRAAFDANLPLGDKAAVRGVFSYAGSNGYIDDTKSRTKTANLGLTFRPSNDLTLFFAAEMFNNDNGRTYWGTPLVARSVARDPTGVASTAAGFVIDGALRKTNFQYLDGEVRSESYWLRSVVDWRINDTWRFNNDLSYNNSDRLWDDAEGYTYVTATRRVNRQPVYIRNMLDFWSNRATLSSDSSLAGSRNRFLIGVEPTENEHLSRRRFGANTPVDPYNLVRGMFPAITPANFPGAGNFADVSADIRLDALFAEDAFNLNDRWLVVGGLRYERIKLDRSTRDYNLATTTGFIRRYEPLSYRIGSVYYVAPKTQLYAQYTQGGAGEHPCAAQPVQRRVQPDQGNLGRNRREELVLERPGGDGPGRLPHPADRHHHPRPAQPQHPDPGRDPFIEGGGAVSHRPTDATVPARRQPRRRRRALRRADRGRGCQPCRQQPRQCAGADPEPVRRLRTEQPPRPCDRGDETVEPHLRRQRQHGARKGLHPVRRLGHLPVQLRRPDLAGPQPRRRGLRRMGSTASQVYLGAPRSVDLTFRTKF